jgi:hypothetical protein
VWVDHGGPQRLTRGRSQSCSAGQVGVRLSGPSPCTVGGRLGLSYSTSADQRHDFDDAFSPFPALRHGDGTPRIGVASAKQVVQFKFPGTRAKARAPEADS